MKHKKIIDDLNIVNMRLDRYVKTLFPKFTQGLIEKMLRAKDIKVNGKKQEAKYLLQQNDEIEIYTPNIDAISDEALAQASQDAAQLARLQKAKSFSPGAKILAEKLLGEYKIFEDDDILAVNKPSELASQGGSGLNISVDDAIAYINHSQDLDMVGSGYRICHRLDKSTSGLFLIAKNRLSAQKLTKAFADRVIKKKYLALLVGTPENDKGVIQNYLAKDLKSQTQIIARDGDYAETEYEVLAKSGLVGGGSRSLVEFSPHTGRMHQIRVHAKSLSCPILGDTKYGHRKFLDKLREKKESFSKTRGSKASSAAVKEKPAKEVHNLFLHALSIHIPAQVLGRDYDFTAKLPGYFTKEVEREFGSSVLAN